MTPHVPLRARVNAVAQRVEREEGESKGWGQGLGTELMPTDDGAAPAAINVLPKMFRPMAGRKRCMEVQGPFHSEVLSIPTF